MNGTGWHLCLFYVLLPATIFTLLSSFKYVLGANSKVVVGKPFERHLGGWFVPFPLKDSQKFGGLERLEF